MKRTIAFFLIGCLCLSFTGCKAWDYGKATKYYNDGQYAQAMELYESLGDYADSAAMAHISRQKADYEAAQTHWDAGEYRQAMELYYGLELYMDSPVKAIESQYALASELLETGEYAVAIQLFEGLGTYENSVALAQKGIALWLQESLADLGGITLTLDEAGQQTLSLVSTGGDTVHLIYRQEHQLLGVPNKCRFALILTPETKEALYEASYLSAADSTILEESSGTVDPAVFNAGQGLSTETFSQTITDPDGVVTVSEDTTDAIVLHSMLSEAQSAITEHFAAILAQTGTDITPEDLGFLSLG